MYLNGRDLSTFKIQRDGKEAAERERLKTGGGWGDG